MAKKTVKTPEPVTYEDFLAKEWDSYRVNMALEAANIPPSNYDFKVGEDVIYGNHEDVKVEEILMDGKLLHLSKHDRGTTYGKAWDNNRRLPILRWWIDVDPVSTVEDTHFNRPRVHTNYTQSGLDSLVHKVYHRGLIDSPDYQRDYVWTLEDKQRLIQSIFDRADIGKFLFLEHPHPEYRLEVVDGKQRLNAILQFIEGRFEFKGKTWFQLSREDKYAFFDLMVQTAQLDATHIKKSDILWLFLTVNVGGVPQTEEHIAKARKMYKEAIFEEQISVLNKEAIETLDKMDEVEKELNKFMKDEAK
jgi:RNAse (barnase) inhibitor barstar